MTPLLDIAGLTHSGLVRTHNEDAIKIDAEIGLVILADGLGGYKAGEIASGIAVNFISEQLHQVFLDKSTKCDQIAINQLLIGVIGQANSAIYQMAQSQSQYTGMGSTLVVALFYGDYIAVAHIGDSRLYRLRNKQLVQILMIVL